MDGQRRTPKQERSRATRDAIVEAAARVFSEVGLERATTARIAEVAGVSPGSMYQYFPSKDALVTALFARLPRYCWSAPFASYLLSPRPWRGAPPLRTP